MLQWLTQLGCLSELTKACSCARPASLDARLAHHCPQKSQGLTLQRAVVHLGGVEFAPGITFVACSRVTGLQGLAFAEPFLFERVRRLGSSLAVQRRNAELQRLNNISMLTLAYWQEPRATDQLPSVF